MFTQKTMHECLQWPKNQKQLKCSSTGIKCGLSIQWNTINNEKKNELVINATTWINLKCIMLNKGSLVSLKSLHNVKIHLYDNLENTKLQRQEMHQWLPSANSFQEVHRPPLAHPWTLSICDFSQGSPNSSPPSFSSFLNRIQIYF